MRLESLIVHGPQVLRHVFRRLYSRLAIFPPSQWRIQPTYPLAAEFVVDILWKNQHQTRTGRLDHLQP